MREEDVRRYERILVRGARLPEGSARRARLRTRAIEGFLPLADGMARRYSGRGESLEDLVQVARVGLVKAVDGFHPDRGSFLAYATPTIRGELKKYFRDQCWDVRVPRPVQDLRARVRAAVDELAQQRDHLPTVTELADRLDVDEKEVEEAVLAHQAYSAESLNATARTEDQQGEVGDLLGDADQHVELVPEWVSLRPALDQLPERERQMLRLRFFDNLTQHEIADRVGISQMHVSRLISRTLSGLRDWMNGDCDHVEVCHHRGSTTRSA